MRANVICIAASVIITNIGSAEGSLPPKEIRSPEGSYTLETGDGVRVADSAGANLVTLANDLEGVQYVDAKWSPDSRLAVVVISYVRGSGVEAAYMDGSGWHKALQSDTDLPVDELARQAGASGRLVAQRCRLGDWLDSRRITVNGELTFSGQKKVRYAYTLVFTGEPGHLDPGGFEEDVIKGFGYHLR
jgi:hypothetical protein